MKDAKKYRATIDLAEGSAIDFAVPGTVLRIILGGEREKDRVKGLFAF